MYRALATLALPAVALAQQTLCQTGDATCTSPTNWIVPKHTDARPATGSTPGITWYKVDVGENAVVGDCPAVCEVDGVIACTPTPAIPCPVTGADGVLPADGGFGCHCVDGWKIQFETGDNYVGPDNGGLATYVGAKLSNAEKSELTFAISRTYVLLLPQPAR